MPKLFDGPTFKCRQCNTLCAETHPAQIYCNKRCRTLAAVERRRDKRKQVRLQRAEEQKCEHCGNPVGSHRRGAKFCSNLCRQAAYRARKESLSAAAQSLVDGKELGTALHLLPENTRWPAPQADF
jgi:hypothetical protein